LSFYFARDSRSQIQIEAESPMRLSQNADTTPDCSSFQKIRRHTSRNNPFNVNRRATINSLLSQNIPRLKVKGRPPAGTASAHLWDRPFPKPKKIPPVRLSLSSKLPLGPTG
jgi:hypothetical protein